VLRADGAQCLKQTGGIAYPKLLEHPCAIHLNRAVGQVKFESIEVAKAAIEQYDGMDMGMGDKLKMVSI